MQQFAYRVRRRGGERSSWEGNVGGRTKLSMHQQCGDSTIVVNHLAVSHDEDYWQLDWQPGASDLMENTQTNVTQT